MKRQLDPAARARRELVRRARMYTVAFAGAALLIAAGGSALVAWMLTARGQPFVRTWLIAMALVVLPGLMATIWKTTRRR